jgi:hypothetical protein
MFPYALCPNTAAIMTVEESPCPALILGTYILKDRKCPSAHILVDRLPIPHPALCQEAQAPSLGCQARSVDSLTALSPASFALQSPGEMRDSGLSLL